MQEITLEAAYRHCVQLARSHYENFPVASWLLPRRLRLPIAVIYAFARTADDIADEGDTPVEQRIQRLEAYEHRLEAQHHRDPVFLALAQVIRQYDLPLQPFHELLTAFKMDVRNTRYADFSDVLHYCRHSANPIGHLLLYLNKRVSVQAIRYSDAVCTALQLINFYQDLAQDYRENNRIYIPQDEMRRHGVTEDHFKSCISDRPMQVLMHNQVQRAREMLLSGRELGTILPGRMGFEARMVIAGGVRICEKLTNNNGNVFSRPRLNKYDWLIMFWQAAKRS